jgi:hypothetical protein
MPKSRRRENIYDGYVKEALAKVWEIFDYPYGQRLAPLLKTEVPRLRQLEEIFIPNFVLELKIGKPTLKAALQ